ncbi:hypothetical protein BDN72DRAFT_939921 [Pluteus cervinus]|uniref:Uncharacterized protein n=1 Tax=Pluteus cervinus TaxID=181527 RepID=A0ACD3A3S8_9AGAR|nr:hypothetical protein BDN72DRAFT_939921 [Pluteus cervinus]
MPRSWTTDEQRVWLETKLPDFISARSRGRSTAYAKGVHHSFSQNWPDIEALFEERFRTEPHPLNLSTEDLVKLQTFKKKRAAIQSWLQRNSTQRGRTANRAVRALLRNSAPRRRRAYQLGEVYNKLYPEKVSAVYQERKVEGLSRGQRLNLIKKISDELLEAETDEVKEEVEMEQDKRRGELDALANAHNGTTADLDELTLQQYINQLPDLLSSVVGEIGKLCPEWGFLVVASGPMPKANNATHVFDPSQITHNLPSLYAGPKSVEGYSFAEAHEDFDTGLRIPFGNFVEAGIVDKVKHEEAREALDALEHRVDDDDEEDEEEDEDEDEDEVTPSSRATSPGDGDEEEEEGVDNPPPTQRPRRLMVVDADSDDKDDPPPPPRLPPQVLPDADDLDAESALFTPPTKHPLEDWPIEQPDSDGEPEVDSKIVSRPSKKSTTHSLKPDEVGDHRCGQTPQTKAQAAKAKRAESTKKRLDTRRRNQEKKDEEIKAAKELEAAKNASEVEAMKNAKKVEAAKNAKVVEATKNAKVVEATKSPKTFAKVLEAAKKAQEKNTSTVDKSKAPKDGKRATKASKKLTATKKDATNLDGQDTLPGEEHPTKDNATPATKRRPPPAIIPPRQVAQSNQIADDPVSRPEGTSPKPKGKKSRKRPLEKEDTGVDPVEEAGPSKRPRRKIVPPTPADAEVTFAKAARLKRRA